MRLRSLALATLIATSLAGPAPVEARRFIEVDVAPPTPKTMSVPPPRSGYVWAPGYWRWQGNRHLWTDGRWVRERAGYHWVPERWEQHGRHWRMFPGHWQRD